MFQRVSSRLCLFAAGALLILPASSMAQSFRTIDVLGVYPDHVSQLVSDPTAMFISNIEYANRALQNSGATYRYNLVHVEAINWANDQSLGSTELSSLRADPAVAALREQYGADLVAGIVPQSNGLCGIGYLAIKRTDTEVHAYGANYAYSLTGHSCGGRSMAHEMGHNMGLNHSYAQGSSGTLAPWARGHGVNGQFVTIMAYQSAYGVGSSGRVQMHATPALNTCVGQPCGVDPSRVDGADAVRAINLSSVQIADYRPSQVVATNLEPDAVADSLSTDQDTPVSANVLANDSDPDGDAFSLVAVSQPAHGEVSILSSAGDLRYQPDPGYYGNDVFEYTIADTRGGRASARVDVTVIQRPVAPASPNLVSNGTLESGLNGWQGVWGMNVTLTDNAIEGVRSLSARYGQGIAGDLETPLSGSRNLTLSAAVHSTNANPMYTYLYVLSQDRWVYRYVTGTMLPAGSTVNISKTFPLYDARVDDGYVLFYFPYRSWYEVRVDSVELLAD